MFPAVELSHFEKQSWIAVQTWPRFEKSVAADLQAKHYEVYLPLTLSERRWSDRRKRIEVPLFPTYLFTRIAPDLEFRLRVLRIKGVSKILGAGGSPSPVPDSEIETVRRLLSREIAFRSHPFLTVGQRVRVRGSSLDGVEGILVAKNNDLSLVVSIQMIQRSLAVRVEGYRLEAA